jgi:hypothetical protein
MADKGSKKALSATDLGLRLSDYPLGSPQSRATARAFLNARRAAQGEGTILRIRLVGRPEDPNQKCTCRMPEVGNLAVCKCFLA